MKILTVALVALIAVVHFGAAQAAPQGDENFKSTYIRTNIIKGKTTADEVLAKFGEPTSQVMNDSSETWTYQRGTSTGDRQRKKGGGFSALMGVVKGVAETAYELAPEKTGRAAARIYGGASKAERAANAASAVGGVSDQSAGNGGAGGASVLQISFTNGVVSSFSLR